jgi:hypothetical protein
MDELHQEWGRKLVEGDLESDEEPSEEEWSGFQLQEEGNDRADSVDGWEDIDDSNNMAMAETLTTVVKESEMGWKKKLAKWERVAERQAHNMP